MNWFADQGADKLIYRQNARQLFDGGTYTFNEFSTNSRSVQFDVQANEQFSVGGFVREYDKNAYGGEGGHYFEFMEVIFRREPPEVLHYRVGLLRGVEWVPRRQGVKSTCCDGVEKSNADKKCCAPKAA